MKRVPARLGAALLLVAGVALAAPGAAPLDDPLACNAWIVTYTLAPGSKIEQSDTPLYVGEGVFDLGPGTLALRFPDAQGRPGPGAAELVSYETRVDFSVTTSVLGVRTVLATHALSRVTPDRCGVAARGNNDGRSLEWTSPVRGYRTDGSVSCRGLLCGRFGMPREGETPLHVGPADVRFSSLSFRGRQFRRFHMPATQVSRGGSPRATTRIQLVARAVGRRCDDAPPCP